MSDIIHWFPARYPGQCKACGSRFNKEKPIGYLDGEIVAYECCQGLGTELTTEQIKVTVCNQCFLVHAPNQKECE